MLKLHVSYIKEQSKKYAFKASVFQYLFTLHYRNIIPLSASLKSPISCSTDFETGCKPVWFFFITYSFLLIFILFLLDIFVFLVSLFCVFFQNVFDIRIILLGKIISLTGQRFQTDFYDRRQFCMFDRKFDRVRLRLFELLLQSQVVLDPK